MSTRLELSAGARQAEEHLLARLRTLVEATRADPGLLARPVRVVVPSRSLRLHLGERIASELGATAGVQVQTLHAAASEILARAGDDLADGDGLIELLARRLAHDEEPLRRAFEPFVDGYRTVASTVRDLLDAGLEPEHAEPALERVEEVPSGQAAKERAQAVVRVAVRVGEDLRRRGIGGRAEMLARARSAFEHDAARTFPTRELLVHGFADATGRAAELIETLARKLDSRVIVDRPSDPDDPTRPDLGCAYAQRLVDRVAGVADSEELERGAAAAPPMLFRAPGASAEVREVARRIRTLLDAGARPERIGIVARDLTAYRAPIRVQLDRLGVPFSALRVQAPLDATGGRIHAFLDLLEQRERCPTDRWLDAVVELPTERDGEAVKRLPSTSLRLGLRVVGGVRLGDVAHLDPKAVLDAERDTHPLPVRKGVFGGPPGAVGPLPRERDASRDPSRDPGLERTFGASRVRLYGADLRGAVAAAKSVVGRLGTMKDRAPLADHLRQLERLRADLGWRARGGRAAEARLTQRLEPLVDVLGDEVVAFDELLLLVRRAVLARAAPTLGGDGGGVQVLDAMEARARTFDHLFVVGLNVDVFPRVVREDPLLGDDVRRALSDVLPDVPVKARGRLEDRYLFAQLCSAAPHVTLSWQISDDDGRARVISPLVERMLGEVREEAVLTAPPIYAATAVDTGPRTAREHLVVAGLEHRLQGHRARLTIALEEIQGRAPADDGPGPDSVATARSSVLEAYDRGPFDPVRLAPWLGFVGAVDEVGVRPDPRVDALSVSRWQKASTCGWLTVLEGLLQLEASPDPLESLPSIERRVLGNVVHGVLERIVRDALDGEAADLAAALRRTPTRVAWPAASRLDELLVRAAYAELSRSYQPQPGLVQTIAECARPYVDRARRIFEDEARRFPERGALAVEVGGVAQVPVPSGGEIAVAFRADRVDADPPDPVGGEGATIVLSDYKTGGRATSLAKLKQIEVPRGRSLQPIAYVLGASGDPRPARGRFVWLDPTIEDCDETTLTSDSKDQALDFAAALDVLAEAWVGGVFAPRMREPGLDRQPQACGWCRVKEACLEGDSGARRAMVALAEGGLGGPLGETLGRAWRLAGRERKEPKAKASRKKASKR